MLLLFAEDVDPKPATFLGNPSTVVGSARAGFCGDIVDEVMHRHDAGGARTLPRHLVGREVEQLGNKAGENAGGIGQMVGFTQRGMGRLYGKKGKGRGVGGGEREGREREGKIHA